MERTLHEMAAYHEITCKSALNQLKRKIPYGWDLNLYRGCQHGCQYCYAMYSHQYLVGSFAKDIYIKTNVVEQLERELSAPGWKREVVNIGGVTDSYQPAEEQYRLMPEILKLLIRYKTPAIISTKSVLALRDFDLIDELSRITYINIAATVTTMDEAVRKLIEPGAAESKKRFAMLKEFRKTNASVGLHMMPVIPYVTDQFENLDGLLSAAKDSGVHYVLPGVLYLRGTTRNCFFAFIHEKMPEQEAALRALFKTGGAGKEYKDGLYRIINALRKKYTLSSGYMQVMRDKLK